jgi:hypothetical protein
MKAKRIIMIQPFIEHDADMGYGYYYILRGPTTVSEIIDKFDLGPTCFEFRDGRAPLNDDDDVYSAVEDNELLMMPPDLP